MPSDNAQTSLEPPPKGDPAKAQKYIDQLITLISEDKIEVFHTDLSKFDPSSLEDHFRVDLKDYLIEISHSKQPNSGKDSYVILFTNLRKIQEGSNEKVILAYMYLADEQFHKFKDAANQQIEKRKKLEEEQKLEEALAPIDSALKEASQTLNSESSENALPET
ncbi:hypothetical protein HY025_02875 [Candidatus Daviesbacteria bacterium]|nr:hypothetical protein [Candidatus Daviesbacteria bacterium]